MSANPLPIIITAIDDGTTIGYFAAKFAIALAIEQSIFNEDQFQKNGVTCSRIFCQR